MVSFYATVSAIVTSLAMAHAAPVTSTTASTAIDFYQGTLNFPGTSTSTSGSCGFVKVASGSITGGTCVKFTTFGIGLHQSPSQKCQLLFFKGSDSCEGDGTAIEVPAGSETTCVNTGVLDGGRFNKGSGIFSCDA